MVRASTLQGNVQTRSATLISINSVIGYAAPYQTPMKMGKKTRGGSTVMVRAAKKKDGARQDNAKEQK